MVLPTKAECVKVLREHYGFGMMEINKILGDPSHPKGLRDEIAIEAMNGLLAEMGGSTLDYVVDRAYRIADLMLEQRLKEK